MRGYASKGFKRVDESDPFYTPPKTIAEKVQAAGDPAYTPPRTIIQNVGQIAREAQAEADAARELGQGRASQALQDQADALREDLESKGE